MADARNGRPRRRRERDQIRALLVNLKSVPCMDCGGMFDPVCMDFDHRPGETKLFNVSYNATRGIDSLMAEIAKCDVVCSNCHRIRTHRLRVHRCDKRPVATSTQLDLLREVAA